jgi:hypothetical protein
MELITLLLTGIIGILSTGGMVIDQVATRALTDSLHDVEQLDVRIDNTPSYQIVNGTLDRVRIASRGLYPVEDVRIALLDLETDPIHLNGPDLRRGTLTLEHPLRAALHLVITQDDLDRALTSPYLLNQLRSLTQAIAPNEAALDDFLNPRLQFLGNNRLRLDVVLQSDTDPVAIAAEVTLRIKSGSRLEVTDLDLSIDDQPVPANITTAAAQILEQQLDLRRLESQGIIARYLQLEIQPDQLSVAAIVIIEPVD